MKKTLFLALAVCFATALTSCKSKESAWQQAYNQATAAQTTDDNTVAVAPVNHDVTVTPVTPTQNTNAAVNDPDVRTINGPLTVVSGNPLKTYSVVVGSFVNQTNALSLKEQLANGGYDSRVVKTNETINGQKGWYRVIASSFNDKNSAMQSRGELRGKYAGAWLLYTR